MDLTLLVNDRPLAPRAIHRNFLFMTICFAVNHGCVISVLNLSVVLLGTEPGAFILVGLGLVFNGSPYYLPTGGDVLLEVALGRTTVHAAPASVQTGVGIALRVARGIGEMDAELTTNPAW